MPTEPDGAPRVVSLDILRGLAILGILFININDMGQSMTASFNDVRHLGWTAADQVAWWLREVLASGTARGLLQMLFGVGMVILTDRAADAAQDKWVVLRDYWWRNIVLFVFGIVHMYILLWPGDILHTYALAALLAVFFRKMSAPALLAFGLSFATLILIGGGLGYHQMTQTRAELAAITAQQAAGQPLSKKQGKALASANREAVAREASIAKDRASIAQEDRGRLGTAVTWAEEQTRMSLSRFPTVAELGSVWESLATILIGAGLFKLGILGGDRSGRFYVGMAVICYAIAIPLRTIGAWEVSRFDDAPKIYWATTEYARLAMTLGHVALVHRLLGTACGRRLMQPFEAAGRTALTVYIAQTMICLWVLYPPFALGLYRQHGWVILMMTALVINAGLLLGANWWIRHYRMAPVEWAWRSIVEGRRLPFRKPQRPMAATDVSLTG